MSLQSTVLINQGLGVVGDLYADSPIRSQAYILKSADPLNNVFGRVFTKVAGQQLQAEAGGTGVFAGFLAYPKEHALLGTVAGGTLAPSLTLPNEVTAACVSMGVMVVELPAVADLGDYVYYDVLTGELSTQAPLSAPLVGTAFANAVVDYFQVTQPGIAVIKITDAPATSTL